jgi:hypothetical protein
VAGWNHLPRPRTRTATGGRSDSMTTPERFEPLLGL